MRDDPIIYEDWKIGFSQYFSFTRIKSVNLVVSLLISLLNLYLGVLFEISSVVFLWTFSILIVILLEGIFDQINRTVLDRSIFAFGLIIIFFITYPGIEKFTTANSDPGFHLFMGVLFGIKLILVPISEATIRFSENILTPKNRQSELMLHDQIERLKSTRFEIDDKTDFEVALEKLIKATLNPFILSLVFAFIISFLAVFLSEGFELVRDFIVIMICLTSGVALSGIILVDYLEKRKQKPRNFNDEIVEYMDIDDFDIGEPAK